MSGRPKVLQDQFSNTVFNLSEALLKSLPDETVIQHDSLDDNTHVLTVPAHNLQVTIRRYTLV